MSVHEVAAAGFEREAEAYEQSRPSYPPDAVAWLAEHLRIAPGTRIADVAAGTGKLTRLLAPNGAALLALEPVAGMATLLRSTSPGVPLVAGTAEALPFADGTLDAITVAQAFHWLDAEAALAEFGRVLVPGGRVGLVWNARDRANPLVDQLWTIMDRVEKRAPWRQHDEWSDSAFIDSPWFGPLHAATFHHEQVLHSEQVVGRFRSVSHVAVLAPHAQRAVLDQVRAVLATHLESRGRDEITIPYRVDVYWCERRA